MLGYLSLTLVSLAPIRKATLPCNVAKMVTGRGELGGKEGQGYRGWCPGGAFARGPETESPVSKETRLSPVSVFVASEG